MNVHDENKDLGEKPEASEQGLVVISTNIKSISDSDNGLGCHRREHGIKQGTGKI